MSREWGGLSSRPRPADDPRVIDSDSASEAEGGPTRQRPRVVLIVLALLLLGAAGAALFAAGLVEWLACEVESSEACERHELAQLQLAVAIAAIAPTLVLAVALPTGKRRATLLGLATAVVFYATWAVLADAAVHGWDDLKIIPF